MESKPPLTSTVMTNLCHRQRVEPALWWDSQSSCCPGILYPVTPTSRKLLFVILRASSEVHMPRCAVWYCGVHREPETGWLAGFSLFQLP